MTYYLQCIVHYHIPNLTAFFANNVKMVLLQLPYQGQNILLFLSKFKTKIICTHFQHLYLRLESNKITKVISNNKINPLSVLNFYDSKPMNGDTNE